MSGARVVRVIRLFLGAGGRVVRNVGRQLSAVRAWRPELRIETDPAVGERSAVADSIADAVLGSAVS
ncbi:MAG: hypothetical protein AB7N24_23880 [Dehalococcoidia bacterium]